MRNNNIQDYKKSARVVTHAGNSLIKTYVELQIKAGFSKTEIAEGLSIEFNRVYTLQLLNVWLRDERPVPRYLHDYLLEFVLTSVVESTTGLLLSNTSKKTIVKNLSF